MAWFFSETEILNDNYLFSGDAAKHIRVLRLREGEPLTIVTPSGEQCEAVLTGSAADAASARIVSRRPCENEPDVFVTLYQALPKGDKMDFIVQKCVELGVSRIVPMLTARCVSRPDAKALTKKRDRWQKIALQAAMQSRRGIIPTVEDCVSFAQATEAAQANDRNLFFYEMGGASVRTLLTGKPKTVGMFIGSEGGFEEAEAARAIAQGAQAATLGKRILRAETAPLAALSIIMYQTDNF
ncbi:MAG: 16S rRNA (uracil(1498)-N(3))-methyltransferase [Ruminococcus sp.]|nr:16S rRNA (uracil(1498)-N(3))-methyltransferase [Ruminococcus sp.]